MKLEDGGRYIVYDLQGIVKGELTFDEGREIWPGGINGWKHALDCTVEPFDERSLEENTAFAAHINKFNVVMRIE